MDEKRLIKQILSGDTEAFSYFVESYQNMAMTIAYRVCRNRTDAEDIVQNAFVSAFQNLYSFKNKGKFSSWFYRIVYNLSLNHVNKQKNKKEDFNFDSERLEEIDISNTSEEIRKKERREKIDDALAKLPQTDAVIISLYYLEGYSVKEIAQIVSLTDNNVKIKLFRARKTLKEIIEL